MEQGTVLDFASCLHVPHHTGDRCSYNWPASCAHQQHVQPTSCSRRADTHHAPANSTLVGLAPAMWQRRAGGAMITQKCHRHDKRPHNWRSSHRSFSDLLRTAITMPLTTSSACATCLPSLCAFTRLTHLFPGYFFKHQTRLLLLFLRRAAAVQALRSRNITPPIVERGACLRILPRRRLPKRGAIKIRLLEQLVCARL